MNLILLGAPGAGKGTQAENICAHFHIPTISTGNMLREAVKNGTKLGLEAKAYMDAGKLVPDAVLVGMIQEKLKEPAYQNGFILDGFPRTVPQAEALDQMGVRIDTVLEIDVPDERIVARMAGRRVCEICGTSYHTEYRPPKTEGICDADGGRLVQRADDAPETVKARLEVYHTQTEPVKAYYAKQDKLSVVEGQEDIADTTRLTLQTLEGRS
ncbi:adenylate kinase [Ethanoligenens harbinense]|uniref:Adenylate kinase n=1 Tax=Ethanoligenens harbinense (strain DSM 18485 / JCM 12961 / CGMCC 1.5033 / YUAN-3) TaxID=663278 RepID=E6U8I2_ETHHY|nr:adenylate kinase [Ethanoligenens harbinense]ADU25973.1 adenylate kinase [Ethanoligenens harbinense YUAN-3]AVQ95124.1 adenylate kinase [Ethanoligenens harbinense YUAN-3]AYF37815.1 adenylate kinase [Ethanoligenens harbinense]AYF40537.1 adenylate kinase [Ethanoligenens harbinense]QCN91370.1 adenylate kinase [Ethanoligenens harbinense]